MAERTDKVSNTVLTQDGTITLRDSETGELYHNSGGALLEAVENYVLPARLEDLLQRRRGESSSVVTMLDACFGLGYNTLALWLHILDRAHLPIDEVHVTAVELDAELLTTLISVFRQDCFSRLVDALRDPQGNTVVENLIGIKRLGLHPQSLKFNYQVRQGPLFTLTLNFGDLRDVIPRLAQSERGQFDLIFHDPFSPSKVPHLWTFELFKMYFDLLRAESGRLLTYSAASAVRGGLAEAGFSVYRTRGVGKKSGGTLAARGHEVDLIEDLIFELRDQERERLNTSSRVPYRDPELNGSRKEILKRREAEQKQFKAGQL